MSQLFTPFSLCNLTVKNRFVMSPMCMYSSRDGLASDFHFAHYGARALGGCGTIVQEATAVTPEGRITAADMGIWDDKHIPPLKRIADFVQGQGAAYGIQLAHAGRKASVSPPAPGKPERQLTAGPGAWQTLSASALPFHPEERPPRAMSTDDIHNTVEAFGKAALRALEIGCRFVEIHAAHGYLVHQFLSPLSNRREDGYGGGFENRIRFLLEIAAKIRSVIPADMPLWARLSAVEWQEGGWTLDDSVALGTILREKGVDLVDASSGGNVPKASIPVAPGYQVPFAERLRRDCGLATSAVGLITEARQAEEIVATGKADLIVVGREFLRDPFFVLRAAHELGTTAEWPVQYYRGQWR